MRIAIVAPPWVPVPPPRYGGTEAVLDGLARGLLAAGHDVLLCASGDSTCPVPIAATVPRARGTVGTAVAAETRHVVRAYERILEWGADVVHDHTLVGPIYSATFEVPVVTTNHGPFTSELGALYRAIAERVPVVAISHHQASTARRTRVAAVIHHGVDLGAFPVGDGDGGYAAFVGRMSADKGVDAAIRIARAAGVPLRIAAKMAEPAEVEYFRARVEPELCADVEYVGELAGAEKVALLGGATCLLNPVRWAEPFGMVMIEALACGTPVVATPHGSVPEIVDDGVTGFVRPTETDLADVVHHAGSIDRSRCRKAAVTRFSVERMVEDHVELYRSVVTSRRPPLRVA